MKRTFLPLLVILAAQPTMIAVGCRHLLSGDGLIAILRREGYTVEPVK